MSNGQAERFVALDGRIRGLERRRVSHKWLEVVTSDAVSSTFVGALPDGQELTLDSPPMFLPSAGDMVRVRLEGATPIAEPVRIAAGAITGEQIGSVPPDRLEDGDMPAIVTVSGAFIAIPPGGSMTTQRTALEGLGLRAWNATGGLTVDLNGVDNLLTGRFRTAVDGRRIEMNVAGDAGQILFVADDGNTGVVDSYTQPTSEEAMRVAMPVSAGDWQGWNAISFQTNDRVYLASSQVTVYYGGGSGGQVFEVREATSHGTTAAGPSTTRRILLDTSQSILYGPDQTCRVEAANGYVKMFAEHATASIDVVVPSAGARYSSPRLFFRATAGGHGSYVKYVIETNGTSPRIEFRNTGDTAYIALQASSFDVNSSEEGKTEIVDWSGDGEAMLDQLRPRMYRRLDAVDAGDGLGPLELGFVAEELPSVVLTPDGSAVKTYSLLALSFAALKRIRQRLANHAGRITTLENAVKSLGGNL